MNHGERAGDEDRDGTKGSRGHGEDLGSSLHETGARGGSEQRTDGL